MRLSPNVVHNATESGLLPMKVLIAVDFGTTFSAVAYTLVNTEEAQKEILVTEWGEGLTADKVPTVLRYENGGTSGIAHWGFEADTKRKPGEKIHEWFKLGLCPGVEHLRALGSGLSRKHPSKTALPPVGHDQCKELVVSYLIRLKDAIDQLFRRRVEEIYGLPRQYIITVPAMWDHGAQKTMKECAAEAFLGSSDLKERLFIVAEPEAAGIYALSEMLDIGLDKGDTFVICDAGGGTVDLSSYEITSKSPCIELKRVSNISGELCGSSFLNRIFEEYLKTRQELKHMNWDDNRVLRRLKAAITEFEEKIKPRFTGLDTGVHYLSVPFPSPNPRDGEDAELEIPLDELREKVFDPVISKICNLVRDQVKSTGKVKKVLLAGGFGQNAYLRLQIEKTVGSKTLKVQKIENSRTAIVRGALMAGLAQANKPTRSDASRDIGKNNPQARQGKIYARMFPRVICREAPRHYGIRVFQQQMPGAPAQQNSRNPNSTSSRPQEVEVMKWVVNKGDEIYDGEPKHFELQYKADIGLEEDRPKIICDVYSSEADSPPCRPHTDRNPVPELEKPLATVCIDLNTIPDESLPCEIRRGRRYYDIAFDMYMTLNSAELIFVLGRGDERYKPANVTVNEIEWGM